MKGQSTHEFSGVKVRTDNSRSDSLRATEGPLCAYGLYSHITFLCFLWLRVWGGCCGTSPRSLIRKEESLSRLLEVLLAGNTQLSALFGDCLSCREPVHTRYTAFRQWKQPTNAQSRKSNIQIVGEFVAFLPHTHPTFSQVWHGWKEVTQFPVSPSG